MKATYTFPKFVPPEKPKGLASTLSQAWDYLVNRKGLCRASEFDDDFSPVGPSLRAQLSHFGVKSSTSGKITIIFFD